MCKKLNFLMVLCIALCLAGNTANANLSDGLVVLHDFEDLVDGSGNGLDLILEGDAEIADGMLWLDGDGDWADVGSLEDFAAINPLVNNQGEPADFTLAIAYATEYDGEWGALVSIGPEAGSGTGDLSVFSRAGGPELDHWWVDAAGGDTGDDWIDGSVHLAIITYVAEEGLYEFYAVEDGEVTLYGESGGFDYSEAWNPDLDYGCRLGYFRNELVAAEEVDWEGWIECQINYFAMWNRVLDVEEMPEVIDFGVGPPSGKADSPDPGDGDDFVNREQELSWSSGAYAVTHNVYFGTDFDDVNEASTDSALLVSSGQISATYVPAEIFDWGQEYFWRVDEINDADPNSPWKGTTWSFIVEPYAYVLDPEEDQYQYADYEVEIHASSVANEDTWADATVWDGVEDGIQNTELWTMWLSDVEPDGMAWIVFPFDKAYQLTEMEIWNYNEDIEPDLGFGFKETVIEYTTDDLTAEDITWIELMKVNLNPAPGEDTPATDTLDLQGTLATGLRLTAKSNQSGFNDQFGLSSVRIRYLPTRAMDPVPEPEEFVELDDLVLEWSAGREATSHKVYLGTDEEYLPLVDTTDETSYEPEGLELDTEYFWRIEETDDPALAGAVWSFITNAFLTIDDMESYEDGLDDPDIAIWGTWADGATEPTNGSLVGYDFGETEKDITHDDSEQSMPLTYDNTGDAVISEATRTYDEAQDWTRSEVKALTLYVHGSENNVGGQMYINVNGVEQAITVDLTDESWQEANIDLADFTGVSLDSVTSMTIGIKGASSSGIVFIDNIRLYPSRCIAALSPEGDINGDCIVDEEDLDIIADNWLSTPTLVEYIFDSDLSDTSGNGYNGVGIDGPVVQDGVLLLDGTNFVDIPFGPDNPFDGTSDYSLTLDFQTDAAGTLFSSARDDNGDNHALALFTANGENAEEGAVVLDHFWIGLAEAGAESFDGEWHTAVVTYSAEDQTILVYLDGEAGEPWEVDVDLPIIPDIVEDTVRIGSSVNPNYPFGLPDASEPEYVTDGNFVGNIDNLRIFSFTLTDDDAAELPDSIPTHPADLNGDGIVDQADKDIVEANLGTESVWP
ncbi:MAG TPA: hypothetical protein DIU00_01715 [Phycisphaerales bacterium]|nr:hypothetical protein [Phycisphaerales bacterium]